MSKNRELAAIKNLLDTYGGKVVRHDPSGKEQKLEVSFQDDSRSYRYHFANRRKDSVRVFERDFRRAINREREKRQKTRI